MVEAIAAALTIARKDIAIEYRTRSAFFAAVVFSFVAATVFAFAFDPAKVDLSRTAPGILWVIFAFSGMLSLQRSFTVELADRAIDGVLTSPVGRYSIFAGKMLANCAFILSVQLIAVPAVIVFYDLDAGGWLGTFAAVMMLATLGMAAIGTLFSSMAVNTRLAELMLPMLALPFLLPIVAFSAIATERLISGVPDLALAHIQGLLAFDLVFVTASALAFPFTIED